MHTSFAQRDSERSAQVRTYFAGKAQAYDATDEQSFWALSDRLLWHALSEDVLPRLPRPMRFLDAGGGTGRWSCRLLESSSDCTGTLVDFSPEMLAIAEAKARRRALADRLLCQNLDLRDLARLGWEASFDLIINFHNVIGFVDDPQRFIGDLARLLVPGGRLVTLAPNQLHAIAFNLSLGRIDAAERAISQRGTFTDEMPEIQLFTPDRIEAIYRLAQLQVELSTGFPNFVMPLFQETQLHGNTRSIEGLLGCDSRFERVYALERACYKLRGIGARGSNLLVVGHKAERPGK